MAQLEASFVDKVDRQRVISTRSFATLVEIFDLIVFSLSGAIAGWARFGLDDFSGSRRLVIVLAVLICLFSFRLFKAHEASILADPYTQLRRIAIALLFTCLVAVMIGYITKTGSEFSRLWVIAWLVSSFGILLVTRPLVALVFRRLEAKGTFSQTFVVFGTTQHLVRLERFLDSWLAFMPGSDKILGVFVDDPSSLRSKKFAHSEMIAGSFDAFIAWNNTHLVDRAIVVLPADDSHSVEPLLEKLREVSINVDLTVGQLDPKWADRQLDKLAGLPTVRVLTEPLNKTEYLLKRTEDIAIAIGALLFLWPLLILVALLIKLDSPGPIIFRQKRDGFNNKTFEVLKFRTMRIDSESADRDIVQAQRNDPRVTRIGRLLRKSSIDELPQLINVLRGDMAIVGPRPHAIEHNKKYAKEIASYLTRHRIKPGITGWAQVNGYRGETPFIEDMQSRIDCDLYYADNWSLMLDIKILLMTLGCLVHPKAY